MIKASAIKCDACGKFMSYADVERGVVDFTPLNEFGPEEITFAHLGCDALAIEGGEEWRPVVGYEGLYECSDLGRIRSLHGGSARILSAGTDESGYPMIPLTKDGKRTSMTVHRVICRAFHGPGDALHNEVGHLDGSRTNCRADNLKWVSKVENHFHRRAHGTAPIGESHPRAKLSDAQALEILERTEAGGRQSDLARIYGISPSAVRDIAKGRRWKHLRRPARPEGERHD